MNKEQLDRANYLTMEIERYESACSILKRSPCTNFFLRRQWGKIDYDEDVRTVVLLDKEDCDYMGEYCARKVRRLREELAAL